MCVKSASSGTERKSSWSNHVSNNECTALSLHPRSRRRVASRSWQICKAALLTSTARIQSRIDKDPGETRETKRSTAGTKKSPSPAEGSKSRKDSNGSVTVHPTASRMNSATTGRVCIAPRSSAGASENKSRASTGSREGGNSSDCITSCMPSERTLSDGAKVVKRKP